ncbi:hypothetical protein [Phocaeicola sp.]
MALGTTGITTSLVGNALGTSSRNVGALCSHSYINMFSRYKPVQLYKKDTTNGITNWQAGDNGTFSISVPTCSLASPTELASTSRQWSYLRPTGGVNYPYRLGDFRGYEHNAPAAFSTSLPVTLTYDAQDISKTAVATGGTYNLGLNDILKESQVYAGVKVQAADGSYYWYSTLAAGARPLSIDFNAPPFFKNNKFLSNIDVSLFLCNYYQSSWASSYPTSNFKCWQPVKTVSRHYSTLAGSPSSLPSANLVMSSINPTKVTWAKSNDVFVTVYVTTVDGKAPTSSLRVKVMSYLGYESSLNFEYTTNPTTSMQFNWVSDGNGTYHSTPLKLYDTLILNSSGSPIKGTTPRSATVQFYEKMVLSSITYYTTLGGRDTQSINLSNS